MNGPIFRIFCLEREYPCVLWYHFDELWSWHNNIKNKIHNMILAIMISLFSLFGVAFFVMFWFYGRNPSDLHWKHNLSLKSRTFHGGLGYFLCKKKAGRFPNQPYFTAILLGCFQRMIPNNICFRQASCQGASERFAQVSAGIFGLLLWLCFLLQRRLVSKSSLW